MHLSSNQFNQVAQEAEIKNHTANATQTNNNLFNLSFFTLIILFYYIQSINQFQFDSLIFFHHFVATEFIMCIIFIIIIIYKGISIVYKQTER